MRYVYTVDGNVAATIDSSGRVTLGTELGAIVGLARNGDIYADEMGGELLGRIDSDGRITDGTYQFVGSVDENGHILDSGGRLLGKADEPIDGAVLILLVGRLQPDMLAGPSAPTEPETPIMDDVMELAQEQQVPGVRKGYRPLTDADIPGATYKPREPG